MHVIFFRNFSCKILSSIPVARGLATGNPPGYRYSPPPRGQTGQALDKTPFGRKAAGYEVRPEAENFFEFLNFAGIILTRYITVPTSSPRGPGTYIPPGLRASYRYAEERLFVKKFQVSH